MLEPKKWRFQWAYIEPLHSSLGDRARLRLKTHTRTHTHARVVTLLTSLESAILCEVGVCSKKQLFEGGVWRWEGPSHRLGTHSRLLPSSHPAPSSASG